MESHIFYPHVVDSLFISSIILVENAWMQIHVITAVQNPTILEFQHSPCPFYFSPLLAAYSFKLHTYLT